MGEKVDVLLATYNGERYLEELLESILTQSHPYLHLWIRDDGSADQTREILKKWSIAYPQKITIIPDHHNVGVKENFSILMKHSNAPYVMFADQDDLWLPHKVEDSLNLMISMERQYSSHIPLLVHTDLKVVDQDLHEIASSFWKYTGINASFTSLNRLLTQNSITGCTMLMNRRLVEISSPIPPEAIMHDWWIGLAASSLGHIKQLHMPTILYRQHSQNDTGAKHYDLRKFFMGIGTKKIAHNIVKQTYQQAGCFLDRYQNMLCREKKMVLEAYQKMEDLSFFMKKRQILKYQFFKQGFLRCARDLLLTK